MDTWQLQDAKNRFSEVVERAQNQGPQFVTKRGVEAVVILSHDDFRKLVKPKKRLSDLLGKSPLVGVELDLERRKDPPRDLEL